MTQKDAEKIAKRLLKEMKDEAGKPRPTGIQLLRSYPLHGLILAGSPKERKDDEEDQETHCMV